LTVWYAAVFTVSSFLAFLIFYLLITAVIRESTDRDLLEQAGKFSALLAGEGMDAVRRIAVLEAQAAGERKIFIRLLSRNGTVFSSSNMAYWKDIDIPPGVIKALLEGGRPIFETLSVKGREHQVRVFHGLISPGVLLQAGQSMEIHARFITAFKRIVIASMAFLAVFAALVGWFMARQALSRLGGVTRTAMGISASRLEGRVPVTGRDDEIDQLAATFNQMLDRIQDLVRGTKEMNDNIAHDLKSPITRIRGIAEITLTTNPSAADYESMAGSTIEECDRLLEMINTMLLISKTEAGVEKVNREKMDLAKVVREACNLFLPLAEDREITLTCRAPESRPFYGDLPMIQRMIANLLDNAIRYSQAAGIVEVSLQAGAGNEAAVSIQDTGTGISRTDLPHIFDRFYRGDPSRGQSGSGLGLSLARAIARAHGGDIGVSSCPGTGSTFTVTLPQYPRSAQKP
jgi:heavy metal sensor kinase